MTVHSTVRALARGTAALAAIVAAAASAQSFDQINVTGDQQVTRTQAVAIHDIDLAAEHGQRVLDHRLKLASAAVCEVWDVSPSRPAAGYNRCYREALTAGRSQAKQRSASNDRSAIRVTAG